MSLGDRQMKSPNQSRAFLLFLTTVGCADDPGPRSERVPGPCPDHQHCKWPVAPFSSLACRFEFSSTHAVVHVSTRYPASFRFPLSVSPARLPACAPAASL
eukprot:3907740-Rhodomonas_salina.3